MTAASGIMPPPMTRVTLVGLGAIGREVLKALLEKQSVRVVAIVDPAFAGQDAGVVAGVAPLGVLVVSRFLEALMIPSDVAVVLTTSGTAEMLPLIEQAASRGVHVVSSCEDLAYADLATPDVAGRIDAAAKKGGITVLGTGVNPGFVMDRLPLALVGACVSVERVWVERVVDAAKRRGPLRAKVGAGLSVEEFQAGVASRRFGHRGLPESCALVGVGLGLDFDEIQSTIEPVVSTAAAPRAGIATGLVAGLRQSAIGVVAGKPVVRLDLEMSVDAPNPHDRIRIEGDPPLDMLLAGGTHGDRGTVATVINAIPTVMEAPRGLRYVTDLPLFGLLS
ncbi:MAG: dihydrodipicolinate reductase [Deltaproteobacteria bacterium]|nr:dihydrodipicolinate reductase [Deltaproteobacteria bacterium]